MSYNVKILADSIGPHGVRLTTMEVTFPRIVLAEFNTHRAFSRNSASSRAIPLKKQVEMVLAEPFVPQFRKNQSGMQPGDCMEPIGQYCCQEEWLCAMKAAVEFARNLASQGVHKQWANRLLEPFMWHTAIVSSTEWANFFTQRCHPDAQDEIRHVAQLMQFALEVHQPKQLSAGEWHLPYSDKDRDDDIDEELWPQLSAGRCARVSYLTHDGKRAPVADLELFSRLKTSGHWSPMEHVAQCLSLPVRERNFVGWRQLRVLEGG